MTRTDQRGATVIEHLVVIVILTIVLAASTSLFSFGTRTFSRETVAVTLQEDMVGAKNMILDELSIAGYRPTELVANGPFPAIGATTILSSADVIDVVNPGGSSGLTTFDDLDFRADVDSDQDTDRICYRLVSGQLRRRVIEDPALDCSTGTEELLLQNVTGFAVQILDASRNVLTKEDVEDGTPSGRFAQVTLTVQSAVKGGTVRRTARGETAIRNWGA